MVFRRRSLALRPVHRIKHVVDASSALASATALNQVLILSVDAPVLGSPTQVETGSKVYGLYLKVVVASNETEVVGAIPNVYMIVAKNPGGNLSFASASSQGSSDNKRFVIHQEMVMIENSKGGNPTTLFDGVIKIPKGYSRFGPNDNLFVGFLSPQIDIVVCLQAHYKEFR